MIKLNKILSDQDIEFLKTKVSFPEQMTESEFADFGEEVIDLETSAVMDESKDLNKIADIVTKITTSKEW